MRRRTFLAGSIGATLATPALAQTYPDRAVRVIVPNPPGGSADYIASKAAVIALIKVAARQGAKDGITANSVAPGPIETPMYRAAVPVGAEGPMLGLVPLGRLGQPGEVAAAIAFLASKQAGYITGSTIDVNGGYRMQ